MKITVAKSELLGKLKSVGKIIQSKNTNPQFDNFLFEVKNGCLTVTGADESGRIETVIDCQAEGKDTPMFALEAKTILDGLKELPDQPLVIEITNRKKYAEISVNYANGKFGMVGGNGEEYPQMTPQKTNIRFTASGPGFLSGIRQVQICCSDDDLRPVLTGVYLDKKESGITYVASNGSILGMVDQTSATTKQAAFIIPSKISRILSSIIPTDCKEIELSVGESNATFEFSGYKLTCRMIEGKYPNYLSVIPQNNDKKAVFKKAEILSALRRVSVFADTASSLIILSFDSSGLVISGQDRDYSMASEETVGIESYQGKPIKIGFKSTLLIELLNNIPSDEIAITLQDPSRAALLSKVSDNDLTYLIMPLSINY